MRWWTVAFFLVVLTGCSNLTKDKYDRIQIGMNYADVVNILGKATQCDAIGGMNDCLWGDEKRNIKIKFITDKVIFMHATGLE